MPEMDGLTLIREAQKHYRFYPMLISGYDDFEYVRTALREGAIDYMLKPVDRDQFRARMAELRERIASGRNDEWKRAEAKRQAGLLKKARQTQTLSYITSAGIDIERLGYWVEDFPRGRYLLMYVSLDALPVKARAYTAKDWEAYTFALENIVAEVVGQGAKTTGLEGWSWRGGNSDFWILLCAPALEEEGLEASGEALAEQVRTAIRTYTPFTVSVAVGAAIEDLYLLPGARRQALALMHTRLVEGGNRTFRQAERAAPPGGAERLDAELAQLAMRTKQAIALAKAEEAEALLKRYVAELERADSPAAIRKAAQHMLLSIFSAAAESGGAVGWGGGSDPAEAVEEALRSLDRATHLQELRSELGLRMREAIEGIREARRERDRKPVEQAKAWIREHLGGDISIKRVADHVFMNPTYFCEYFKQQTGETVLDYVTRQRMEKAKELLADPLAKLQEVSVKVGYQDAKYFGKLFKQWAGVSPSRFRDRAGDARVSWGEGHS